MSRLIKVTIGVAVYGALQGCQTMGIGESEFSCPGIPNGVRCMSAKDVYHNTNGGNIPASMDKKSGKVRENQEPVQTGPLQDQYNDLVTKRYVEANLPYQPIPIRTPSQTMRIFIAPYEDVDGDLLMPGLVYTDIEERRWVIGEQYNGISNTSFKLTKPSR